MFVILTYDIAEKRVAKVLKTCRRYLVWRQRSVFEGKITEAKLERLKRDLAGIVDVNEDYICIYKLASIKYTRKDELGGMPADETIL